MNNSLCKESSAGLVLFLLTIAGALLLFLLGSIMAYYMPSDQETSQYGVERPNPFPQNQRTL